MIRKCIANAALMLMLSAGSFTAFGQTPAPANCPYPNCPRASCPNPGQQRGQRNGQGQGQCRRGQNMGARNSANRK